MTASVPGSTAIDAALVERFKQALDRLNPEGGKIGLAVSGGPDSMAMLLLATEAIPGGFEVATVDHGLRPEARDECALVVAACEKRGVPCEVLTVEVAKGNVQAGARRARYSALGQWSARRSLFAVATAHHADDQAETLLMRLNRASGIDGLVGIRKRVEMPFDGFGPGTTFLLIRPLLDSRRAELRGVVADMGLACTRDPSNEDESYDRVRVRTALADADWLDPAAVASSASHLADALDALDYSFWSFYEANLRRTEHDGEVDLWLALPANTPQYFLLRALDMALRNVGGDPRGGDVARLLKRLRRGENANLAGVLVTIEQDEWYFRREPPRRTCS